MDRAWWNEYADELAGFAGECWTTNREAARIYRLNVIPGEPGLRPTRPTSIALGASPNSGFQAVGLALHFGAARVVLLGYDMANRGRLAHWHGNHARLGNPIPGKFKTWIAGFEAIAVPDGVQIVNASRESALRRFPRMLIDEAVDSVKNLAA